MTAKSAIGPKGLMTSGKSVALVQSRATDFPAVINVGYCPRVRAITNTYKTNDHTQ